MKGLLIHIAATLLVLTACSAEKTTQEYLDSANQYQSAGNQNAAVIELKNALRQTPTNVQARVLLGDIYYEQGKFPFAEKEYANALLEGANPNRLAPKLALTYHKTSKYKEIDKLAAKYSNLEAESAATVSAIQALGLYAQGKTTEAKEQLFIAEQKQSDNIYTRLGQVTLSLSSLTPEEKGQHLASAISTIDEVLAVAPETIEALLLKGHLLMAQKNYPQAEASFTKVIALAPAAPQYLIYQVQSQMKQNKLEEASPTIDKLLTAFPEHPTLHEFKARVLYTKQEFQEALPHAEKAIQNGSNLISTYVVAGIAALKEEQLEKSYRYLSQVQDSLPNDHIVTRIFAYLQLQLGYTDDATQTLDHLTDLNVSDAALFSTATAALVRSGDSDKALSFAEKAASLDETGANSVKLGILKLANEDESGLEDLEHAIATSPELTAARLALVYGLLQQGKKKQAQKAADDMVQAFPDDPRSYTLKGLVEKRLNNTDAALSLFEQALSKSPNDAITLLSKAALLTEQGKEPDAFELHKQNLQHNADKPYIVKSFMNHVGKFKRDKEASSLLEATYSQNPASASLTWAYAINLATQQQPTQAIKILTQLNEKQQVPATRQLLGDLYIQSRQLDKAEEAYREWLRTQPDVPKIYQRLIAVNELQRDYPEALFYSQKGLDKFPQNQVFKLLEATMLYENGQVHAAGISLSALNEQAVAHPVAIRLKARIATREKDYKQALTQWQSLYNKQPNATTLVSLATAFQLTNQPQQAIALLEQDLNKYPVTYPAHLKLAEHYMSSHPKKALTHYEAVLTESPNNVLALNNASWLLLEEQQYTKAEEYSRKAYQLSKQNAMIGDTYGLILLRQGKLKDALPILEAAYEAASNNAEIAIHYAEALIEQGNKSRAKSILSVANPEDKKLVQLKSDLLARL